MNLIFVGISSGIVAAIWAAGSMAMKLATFAGFLAWSTYFAAGRGKNGIKLGLLSNLSGIIWGFLEFKGSIILEPYTGEVAAMAITAGVGAVFICLQARFSLLSFIPGAFIGATSFFVAGQNLTVTITSMICGSLLGFACDKFTDVLASNRIVGEKGYLKKIISKSFMVGKKGLY